MMAAGALWLGQIGIAQQRLQVKVDPRFELISVVEMLSAQGFGGLVSLDDTSYRRDVLAWFGTYRAHPAITGLVELATHGYDHDAPMGTAVCLSSPPELDLEADPQECSAGRAGGAGSLNHWLDQLRDFARKSDFMTFFRAHAGLYSMIEESTRSRIPRDYAADLECYFGVKQASFHLVPAPLLTGGNYGPSRRHPNGTLDLYGIVSSTGQSKGIPQFGTVQELRYQAWHEFAHSFINPEMIALAPLVDRSHKLMLPIEGAMRSQAYDQWMIVVYEHVVRAVTTRLAFRELGKEEGEAALLYEKSRGFAYVESLADALKEYEQQRGQYATFHDFAPRLLEVLEALSSRDLPKEFYAVPYTGTMASAGQAGGPTVLIVPTGEADPATQQRILEYVKKVQAQFFAGSAILTDEQALAKDLSAFRVNVYGTPAGNKWLARYRNSIPALALLEHRSEAGQLRLIATMPNPKNPTRGVAVYTATMAGAVVGIHNLFCNDNWAYVVGKDQTVLTSGVYSRQDGHWVVR